MQFEVKGHWKVQVKWSSLTEQGQTFWKLELNKRKGYSQGDNACLTWRAVFLPCWDLASQFLSAVCRCGSSSRKWTPCTCILAFWRRLISKRTNSGQALVLDHPALMTSMLCQMCFTVNDSFGSPYLFWCFLRQLYCGASEGVFVGQIRCLPILSCLQDSQGRIPLLGSSVVRYIILDRWRQREAPLLSLWSDSVILRTHRSSVTIRFFSN